MFKIFNSVFFMLVIYSGCLPQNRTVSGPEREPDPVVLAGSAEAINRAIEVVQKSDGVYYYTYNETLNLKDPRTDYNKAYRVYDREVVNSIKELIADNREYDPQMKVRCLPVYDSGVEFREEGKSELFLFSFRCNTILYYNGPLFNDFTPQRNDFYRIFNYEINEKTANPVGPANNEV